MVATPSGVLKVAPLLVDGLFSKGSTSKADPEQLLEAVLEKNWMWLNYYKIPNGVHVFGDIPRVCVFIDITRVHVCIDIAVGVSVDIPVRISVDIPVYISVGVTIGIDIGDLD